MRIITGCLMILLMFVQQVSAQKNWIKSPYNPGEVVCYGSGMVEKGYVPPPDEVLYRLKSGQEKTCDIVVTYTSFPDSVKQAFEYAVSIWEQLLESDVPIYVSASWKVLGTNTLASCGATNYYRNLDEMYFTDRYYAIAAAEKISGKEINASGSADISASFNKNISWYFGTDGNTPSNKYDFVSTIMHELAHGLGFIGFFDVNGNVVGYDDPPAIFDQYLANVSKQFLIDENIFTNPSVNLYKAVTNNALYFRSPASIHNNNGAIPRLYAPTSFSSGSSIYHLNEFSYQSGSINSLMTYAAGTGEAIHDPGPITMGIMADIGWKNMRIEHTPLKDIESVTAPIYIKTYITSDYLLDTVLLLVYFSDDNFVTKDSVQLVPGDEPNSFLCQLPAENLLGEISYYISATDEKTRVFTNPANAPENVYSFTIGPDTSAPVIVHQPREFVFDRQPVLNIIAFVDDNIAVDSVWVEYFLNEQNVLSGYLNHDSLTEYSAGLPLESLDLSKGDTLKYRVVARDKSSNKNIANFPDMGYFKVIVEESYAPVAKYSNDFNNSTQDFIGDDFEVKTTSGFLDGALHSPHPYDSPEEDDLFFNYSAYLRYPVILAENGSMNYDEIVLVEPGEDGTVYGDEEFWDYVIVEGSKNFGDTWELLTDGYDSRNNQTWNVEYENGIDDNGDSQTSGTKEMFVRKNIVLTKNGNFSVGDTVFIRFRLYSDPYAHGWGWAIDNLRIQSIVSTQELAASPGDFRVYPNPTNGTISIEYNSIRVFDKATLVVFDNFGKQMVDKSFSLQNQGIIQTVDLSAYPAGLYLVRVVADGKQVLARKIVKQ